MYSTRARVDDSVATAESRVDCGESPCWVSDLCRASSARAFTHVALASASWASMSVWSSRAMTWFFWTRVPSVTFSSVIREVILGERSALRSASTYPVAVRTVLACPSVTTEAVAVSTFGGRSVCPVRK